ncbi:hypothetical protein HHI36_011952 [Cryptolaemus montrouzieri]|uniref:Peptide deformylase n=1 Tax=Cryptolaemus montrouzieri TaxID=559131 RepID=A0ABD2NDL0_9CUCU
MAIKLTNTHVGTIYSQTRLLSYKTLFSWYSGLLKPKPIKPPHKHIIQIGDPRLRAVSQPVPYDDIYTEKIQSLVKHLAGIFKKYNCIGLSAPQVGVQLRIFIMGLNEKSLQEYSPKERKLKEITLIKPMF